TASWWGARGQSSPPRASSPQPYRRRAQRDTHSPSPRLRGEGRGEGRYHPRRRAQRDTRSPSPRLRGEGRGEGRFSSGHNDAPATLPRMPSARILPAAAYRRERWRNGAGWTRQIHAEPSADATHEWDWRLSIAEIESDAPFSGCPGVDRELVLLEGEGLRLRFDDGEQHTLLPPHDRLRFAGERALVGELVDGPTRDFNLMWRRDAIDAQLWHRPL